MNNYIENNNTGIIALIKRNQDYHYYGLDSSYCVLYEYEKEIRNGEYFLWLEECKLDLLLMKDDFKRLVNCEDNEVIRKYSIWEKPNLIIDFDSNKLVSYYHDRAFENMVPKGWQGVYVPAFEEFTRNIPLELKYWINSMILIDYLNGFENETQINNEIVLIELALSILELDSYEERWDRFEIELGGNIMNNKEFAWLSLRNYHPNLVANRESKKFYLSFLLDQMFKPKFEVDIVQIVKLLQQEIDRRFKSEI